MRLLSLLLIILTACSTSAPQPEGRWQEISGRDSGNGLRSPIYHVRVPQEWKRIDPVYGESIADSTKPNCTFVIDDLHIVIHSFPGVNIPPGAQVARWKRQYPDATVRPSTQSGFSGLFFEAPTVLGWAMQIAPEHAQTLRREPQRCADWTIKATGSAASLTRHRAALLSFAQSFELIEEIR